MLDIGTKAPAFTLPDQNVTQQTEICKDCTLISIH